MQELFKALDILKNSKVKKHFVKIQGKEVEPAKFIPIDEYAIGFYVANLSPRRDEILLALNQAITRCTK